MLKHLSELVKNFLKAKNQEVIIQDKVNEIMKILSSNSEEEIKLPTKVVIIANLKQIVSEQLDKQELEAEERLREIRLAKTVLKENFNEEKE